MSTLNLFCKLWPEVLLDGCGGDVISAVSDNLEKNYLIGMIILFILTKLRNLSYNFSCL